jgi:hypothetical protein
VIRPAPRAVVHASQGGRRDFDSSVRTRARYEIQVDHGFADQAEPMRAHARALTPSTDAVPPRSNHSGSDNHLAAGSGASA